MTKIDPIFEKEFKKLYGKPCWGVKNTIGSVISFDFGRPHLEMREPIVAGPRVSRRVRELLAKRQVFVHGQWHLLIWMCDWEIFQDGKRIGSDKARSNMDRVVRSLEGQKLVRFSIAARGTHCRFEFDLGGVLVTTRPDADYDHWTLFNQSRHVLTLRGDGRYSYHRSNQPHDAGPWKRAILRNGE